jgi:hypothetical protein
MGWSPSTGMKVHFSGEGEVAGKMADQFQDLHQVDGSNGGVDAVGKPIHLPDGVNPRWISSMMLSVLLVSRSGRRASPVWPSPTGR